MHFKRNATGIILTFVFYSVGLYFALLFKPAQWKIAFDALVAHTDPWPAFHMIILGTILAWLMDRLGETAIVIAESRIIRQLKNYALKGLLGKSTTFFNNQQSGGLVAKARRFSGVSETVIDQFVFSFMRSLLLVVYLFIFTSIALPSLAPIFIGWIILFCVLTIIISRIRMKYDLESSQADSKTTGHLSDILLSLFTFRIFSATEREYEAFKQTTLNEQKKRRISWFIGNIQWAVQGILIALLEIFVMRSMVARVQAGTETIGTAVMVQAYIASLAMYMWSLGQSLIKTRTAFADAYEMSDLLDHENVEPIELLCDVVPEAHNSVEMDDVVFTYENGKQVIHNLNFTFHSGRRYGLVGRTGSGKTTIIKLLLRLHEAQSGSIYVKGVDVTKVNQHQLRSWISFVPQHPIFPSRSVRNIISLGRPGATMEEIENAAQKASCDFIWDLPKGFDTQIGERGVKLSGGECQRLAIAAAILEDAPIVIMDEPTSALDAETERIIQESIKTYFHDKTLIVIAHRLSTVAVLDEVILMQDGAIIDARPHEELLESSSEYRNMWKLQTQPEMAT